MNKTNRLLTLIAEVKIASPFGWRSSRSWDELFKIADRWGDWISIHTDPRWGGSMDLVEKARSLTDKPILAKGIHSDDAQISAAIEAGADAVLVVGRTPGIYQDKCWLEPSSLSEIQGYPPETKIVWNSRDLETGGLKSETFDQARRIWEGWLCQASNIRSKSDVNPETNAVLVGSYLPEFIETLKD